MIHSIFTAQFPASDLLLWSGTAAAPAPTDREAGGSGSTGATAVHALLARLRVFILCYVGEVQQPVGRGSDGRRGRGPR
jgi:hypothetical protein